MKNVRTLIAMAAITIAALPAALAAEYPEKPVSVVVGYSAGGPTDVLMRAIGERLSKEWKQPVVVDNRPGASEQIAAQFVATAAPDGYTLMMATEVPLTMNQYLYGKLRYDPEKDFAPVTLLLRSPLALVVPASSPANTLQEFIATARARAGAKPMSYASAGSGTSNHLTMAMLVRQNRLEMTHVPYKGIAPLLTDVISGQVDSAWVGVSSAVPFVRDGRVKALVVGTPARVQGLPQVPVFSETGVPAVQADFIFALMAPAGTPLAVRDKIAGAVRKILADPEFRAKNSDPFGYVTMGSTPAELADYLAKDRPLQAERIKASGAKLD